jgi:hypothetical protein
MAGGGWERGFVSFLMVFVLMGFVALASIQESFLVLFYKKELLVNTSLITSHNVRS